MEEYDPYQDPDPEEWLMTDEGDRTALIEIYHEDAGIDVPNLLVHATIHCIVENQVAMGDEIPVKEAFLRLMKEGLDRHEAVHAVGTVLIQHLHDLELNKIKSDPNEHYYRNLKKFTAKKWRKM